MSSSPMTTKNRLLKTIENKENMLKKILEEIQKYDHKIPLNIRNQIKGAKSIERIKHNLKINKTEKDLLKNKQFRQNCYEYLINSIKEIYLKNHNLHNSEIERKYKQILDKFENFKENNQSRLGNKNGNEDNALKCTKCKLNCCHKTSVSYDKKLLKNKPKSCLKNGYKDERDREYQPSRKDSFTTLHIPPAYKQHLDNNSFGNIFHHQTYLALQNSQYNQEKRSKRLKEDIRNAIMLGHEKNSLYGKQVDGFIKNLVELTNR